MALTKTSKLLKCQEKLYRFAISLTKDIDEAKDLYQESMLKLWEKRNEWGKWENFEAYAMTTVRNTFLNQVQKQNRHPVLPISSVMEQGVENETEYKMNMSDLMYKFELLVSKLPEIQREVLYLREIEEMEYKEIAQILCISEVQVKVYIFRGRQRIKKDNNGK
jgi:RNA polymerase sigma-70 factor (ECF subfamily)